MPKRILLVDDDELFLNCLKEELSPYSNVFETDICFSVNEAIKHLVTRNYNLVVTDIQMPKKSGLELLVFLKNIRFTGKIMVMSAYCSDNINNIKSLGVVDIISKPFELEWFRDMLLRQYKKKKKKSISATFESIDLVTVMQIINMEKKTANMQIDFKDQKGMINFVKGEIIHAEYDGLEGEDAIQKLITLDEGKISVKSLKGKVKRTMDIPFLKNLMNIMKIIDECRHNTKTLEDE